MNIRLRQLQAFVELAKTQSFTLAAQNLFITQSALSSLIKQMETNLGLQLFDRSTRRVELSAVGHDLYPHISQILLDLEQVLDEAANLKSLKTGVVRIAAPQLLSCTVMPPLIQSFQTQHPQVEIQLVDCGVEQVANKVLANEVDIGIGPERDLHDDIQANLFFDSAFCAVIPPCHPLNEKKQIRWQDLKNEPLILLQGHFTQRLFGDLTQPDHGLDVQLRPTTQVSFMSTALSMVHSGLGLAICLPYARPLVTLYGLNMHVLHEPQIFRRFYIFQRAARALAPAVGQFKAHLLSQTSAMAANAAVNPAE